MILDDPNPQDSKVVNDIFDCVSAENLDQLTKYIQDPKIAIWTLRKDNSTVLLTAAFLNLTEASRTIIEETKKRLGEKQQQLLKEFLDCTTEKGLTALHYASFRGNIILASLLIDNGASLTEKCNLGMDVLHFAAQGDQPSSLVFFKEKYKISIKTRDLKNNTPLHWCAINNKTLSLVFLLQWETNINELNEDGQTALHIAVQKKHIKVIKKLLQNGADPMLKDKKGKSCLDLIDNNELRDIFKRRNICETLFFRPTITKKKLPLVNVYLFIVLHLVIFSLSLIIILPVFDNVYLDVIYFLMFFLVFMLYVIMMKSDPGNLTTLFKRNLLAIVEKGENIADYCPFCNIYQKPTTKHCLVCNKCIDFFDHHCFWLNNCIGVTNYFCFIAFLVVTILNNFLNVGICIYSATLSIDISGAKWRLPFMIQNAPFFYYTWTRKTINIIIILVCIGFLYPVVSILLSQRKTINKMSMRTKQKKEDKLSVPLLTFDEIGIDKNIFVSVNMNAINND